MGEVALDAAANRLDAVHVRLAPGDDIDTLRATFGDEPVVVDDCHHLYTRAIGGFEPIEQFLEVLAHVDTPVVTGWNSYAWAYLTAAQRIDREFPVRVEIESLTAGDLAELVLGRYDELPRFLPNDSGTDGLLSVRRYTLEWRDHTVSVPVPIPNPAAIVGFGGDGEVDPKEVVFERLAVVSDGNAGVATAIWESLRSTELRPSDIVRPETDLALNREEAFCLRIILAKECVEQSELAEIIDDGLDHILGRLVREGLVTVEEDIVSLKPTAVPTAVSETEQRRIL
ncbi:hypothetical protein ACOZ4B_04575 [Haloferax prahovense]|uniref:hypothetical protein n=1 Tax=Haloferax prahovense TaxID=381852 RepID=UPI003C7085B2